MTYANIVKYNLQTALYIGEVNEKERLIDRRLYYGRERAMETSGRL